MIIQKSAPSVVDDKLHNANGSVDGSDPHQWSLTLPAPPGHSGAGLSDEVVVFESVI